MYNVIGHVRVEQIHKSQAHVALFILTKIVCILFLNLVAISKVRLNIATVRDDYSSNFNVDTTLCIYLQKSVI